MYNNYDMMRQVCMTNMKLNLKMIFKCCLCKKLFYVATITIKLSTIE